MYAKTLIPGPPLEVPAIISTTSDPDVAGLLLDRGWAVFGTGEFPEPPGSEIRVTPTSLTIQAADDLVVLQDDTNPISPPGWWQAVDSLGGRCVVVIPPAGSGTDLTSGEAGAHMLALMNSQQGVCALVSVRQEV